MLDLVIRFIHFLATLARLLGPGGVRSVVAESLLVKQQLLIMNRSRQRAPDLSASDRVLAGWLALSVRPSRLLRSAIVLKASSRSVFTKPCAGESTVCCSPPIAIASPARNDRAQNSSMRLRK